MNERVELPLAPAGEQPPSLHAELDGRTRAGRLYTLREDARLQCTACAHRCVIAEGSRGACAVRSVRGGELRVPWGYVARRYVRSVETNTVFHVRPGARALTFGMFGCDLRCPYCHNARVSQALRDPQGPEHPTDVSAEALVEEALDAGCSVLCAAYNEPMISAEWAYAVFEVAKRRGLTTVIVSDGNSTREALTFMRPVTDVFRVDLKGFNEAQYRTLGGRFEPVMSSIELAKELGFWVEVVTLVVPSLNYDIAGLSALASRLAGIDRDMPWHVNAFVPRYKFKDRLSPDPMFLISLAGTAYARGLRYVYASNALQLHELAHTRCPSCSAVVVERFDYQTKSVRLECGCCPSCKTRIPGIWD